MLILPITIVLFSKNKFNFFFKNQNIIIIILFSLWLIKNILLSGCAIFPIQQTCLSNIYWNSSLLPSANDVHLYALITFFDVLSGLLIALFKSCANKEEGADKQITSDKSKLIFFI